MSQKTLEMVPEARVAFDRFFMPESLTPLAHTRDYHCLPLEVRRRYNQLHALYVNEQIAFFEISLAPFIEAVARTSPELAVELRNLIQEERRHSRMFQKLNLAAAPEYYGEGPRCFVEVSYGLQAVAEAMMRWPRVFPVFLWVILLQEERALHYSREFAECPELDPYFLRVYRRHQEDESHHLELDRRLLSLLWEPLPLFYRRLQARLLGWIVSEFLWCPRRSAVRVVEALTREFPGLSLGRLKKSLAGLATRGDYLRTLYPRKAHPLTFESFERYPEMSVVAELLSVRGRSPSP